MWCPLGLLPAMTVALTMTAKRLASKNCLVKNLESVETLGSTSTICTDKTGTLTQNRMTVENCYFADQVFTVTHNRQEVEQQMAPVVECWEAFSRCCRLCSRAEFVETDTNPDIMKKQCSGDASETAILRFTESINGSVAEYRRQYPKVAERPFSSSYKYQFSIHKNSAPGADGSNFFLVMKGAPERILQMCGTYMEANGQTQPIDERFVYGFEETYRSLGTKGLRVLALCDYEFTQFPANHRFNLDEEMGFELKNLRFLGLVAMIDPPRY
jgi:sodium/potassium-transporting ATPase subunit alpha